MKTTDEVINFLSGYDIKVSDLALKLRTFLFKILPDIQEELDVKARIIGYGYGSKYSETICAMILSKSGLKLGFYKGASLPDPHKLLAGSGKVHKYAEIKTPEDINSAGLKKLILAALSAYRQRTK